MSRIDTVAQYEEARRSVGNDFAENLRKRHRDLAAKRLISRSTQTQRLHARAKRKNAD